MGCNGTKTEDNACSECDSKPWRVNDNAPKVFKNKFTNETRPLSSGMPQAHPRTHHGLIMIRPRLQMRCTEIVDGNNPNRENGERCGNTFRNGETCPDHPTGASEAIYSGPRDLTRTVQTTRLSGRRTRDGRLTNARLTRGHRNAGAASGAAQGGNNLRRLAAPNSSSSLCSAGILSAGLVAGFVLSKLVKCSSRRRRSTEVYYQ